jgi:hypothetical protein
MGLDKELRTLATTVASELAEAEEGLTLTEQAVRSCRAVEERFEASVSSETNKLRLDHEGSRQQVVVAQANSSYSGR